MVKNKKGSSYIDVSLGLLILGMLVIIVATYNNVSRNNLIKAERTVALNMATLSAIETISESYEINGFLSETQDQIIKETDSGRETYITDYNIITTEQMKYIIKYRTYSKDFPNQFVNGAVIL